tara:strand:- start:67 stop:879 length:813 start_codon:yes stop_codon:yes gene_type:complete
MKEIIQELNPFLIQEQPEVTIHYENFIYKKEKKKKEENKFKIGMYVSWLYKGKKKYGFIKKLREKGALVIDKNEKEKIKKLTELTIEEDKKNEEDSFEPEPELESPKIEEKKDNINYSHTSKKYKWLSTFNVGEPFKYNNIEYPSVENAFHAQKISDDDPRKEEYQMLFSTNKEPILPAKEAKKMSNKTFFKQNNFLLRKDWDTVKNSFMKEISEEYYLSNKEFLTKLIETNDKNLIYTGIGIDNYWGIHKGEGENNHGKILMELREELK